jgi:hypothetical protein
MPPTKSDARLAGLLYLPVVLLGPVVLLYIPGKIFVPGDASATVANLLAHESLFRANIVLGAVSQLFFVATVLALYQLLRDVGRRLAGVMVILILLVAPLAIAGAATETATLRLLHDPRFLAGFTGAQRDGLVTLLLEFDRHGTLAVELYWGLWLLPLGVLVHRSRFLPRFLGVWLVANGAAYVILSLVGTLWPSAHEVLFKFATPLLLGEAVLALWLVVFGGRIGAARRDLEPQV